MSKIGIFLPGKHGDIICATSVLKYKKMLWPDKEVIWFCGNTKMKDLLKYNDAITEIRHWDQGWDLSEIKIKEDFRILKTHDNKLNQEQKHNFDLTKDLEEGYFPTPWMVAPENRQGLEYPNIPKTIFGVNSSLEWHPYLCFSTEEREMIRDFCFNLPYKKTIMIENKYESDQSKWNDNLTINTMKTCRNILGDCNFVFASAGDNSQFIDDTGSVSAAHFTVRQAALINNYSDLFIGVSSGISGAVNCWENNPTPKIMYAGSLICSTQAIANGRMETITTDYNIFSEQEFISKLTVMLNDIK